jgi:predicted DNA-binding ribbon-helix-helix protein
LLLGRVTTRGYPNKLNLCCASHPRISEHCDLPIEGPVDRFAGHKTSVSLEDAFWTGLKDIAIGRNKTLSDLVAEIDTGRPHGNLSSALRLFVLDHYRAQTNGRAVESSDQTPLMVMPATSVLRPQ